jgi:hypothetical protein
MYLENQVNSLESTITTLENEIDNIQEQVNIYSSNLENSIDAIWLRFGTSDNSCQKYITPEDSLVVELVFNVTGRWAQDVEVNEMWDDFEKLYNWVVDNIEYNIDNPIPVISSNGSILLWHGEYWRFPNETVNSKRGDCEDMAVLLTSMIKCYTNQSYRCWVICWTNASGHAATAMPVQGGEFTLLDPAGNFYTNKALGYLSSKNNSDAIDEWFEHWKKYPDIYVNLVFSDKIYETFTSTEDFMDWRKAS